MNKNIETFEQAVTFRSEVIDKLAVYSGHVEVSYNPDNTPIFEVRVEAEMFHGRNRKPITFSRQSHLDRFVAENAEIISEARAASEQRRMANAN